MYNNKILNPRPEIRTTVEECMEQGIDVMTYLPKYETTPLFLALDEFHEPEIIQLLIKNGYDMTQKTPYYDTVHDNEYRTFVSVNRYKSIENIILRHYYFTNNSDELDDKLLEKYKKQPNYKPPRIIGASAIVYKKTDLERKPISEEDLSDDDDSTYAEGCESLTEEEVELSRAQYTKFIQARVKQYYELFNINIDALIEKGEVYPDDLTYPRI
jgi:hypothetical protein